MLNALGSDWWNHTLFVKFLANEKVAPAVIPECLLARSVRGSVVL